MRFLGTLIFCFILFSCENNSKRIAEEDKSQIKDTDSIHFSNLSDLKGKLFEFSLTTDSSYCDFSQTFEGDCNSGYLYFTARGKVIYRYVCVSAPEVDYEIGTISEEREGVKVVFDQTYNIKIADMDPTLEELNSGTLLKENTFTIHLIKTKCKGTYGFEYRSGENVEYYYVKQDKDQSANNYFIEELNKIQKLSQFK